MNVLLSSQYTAFPAKVCHFSSAWLCQQSSWNRNSSVVRRTSSFYGIDYYLWSYCMDFFQISVVASPGRYAQTFFFFFFFFIFEIYIYIYIFCEYFSFSLTWDPMGAKTSKRYPSLKSLWIISNIFWIFFSVVLTKVLFWIFEILSFWFFRNFVRFR